MADEYIIGAGALATRLRELGASLSPRPVGPGAVETNAVTASGVPSNSVSSSSVSSDPIRTLLETYPQLAADLEIVNQVLADSRLIDSVLLTQPELDARSELSQRVSSAMLLLVDSWGISELDLDNPEALAAKLQKVVETSSGAQAAQLDRDAELAAALFVAEPESLLLLKSLADTLVAIVEDESAAVPLSAKMTLAAVQVRESLQELSRAHQSLKLDIQSSLAAVNLDSAEMLFRSLNALLVEASKEALQGLVSLDGVVASVQSIVAEPLQANSSNQLRELRQLLTSPNEVALGRPVSQSVQVAVLELIKELEAAEVNVASAVATAVPQTESASAAASVGQDEVAGPNMTSNTYQLLNANSGDSARYERLLSVVSSGSTEDVFLHMVDNLRQALERTEAPQEKILLDFSIRLRDAIAKIAERGFAGNGEVDQLVQATQEARARALLAGSGADTQVGAKLRSPQMVERYWNLLEQQLLLLKETHLATAGSGNDADSASAKLFGDVISRIEALQLVLQESAKAQSSLIDIMQRVSFSLSPAGSEAEQNSAGVLLAETLPESQKAILQLALAELVAFGEAEVGIELLIPARIVRSVEALKNLAAQLLPGTEGEFRRTISESARESGSYRKLVDSFRQISINEPPFKPEEIEFASALLGWRDELALTTNEEARQVMLRSLHEEFLPGVSADPSTDFSEEFLGSLSPKLRKVLTEIEAALREVRFGKSASQQESVELSPSWPNSETFNSVSPSLEIPRLRGIDSEVRDLNQITKLVATLEERLGAFGATDSKLGRSIRRLGNSLQGLANTSELRREEAVRDEVVKLSKYLQQPEMIDSRQRLVEQKEILQAVENLVKGQEAVGQLNPLLQALGEPAMLLFPAFIQGLLSKVEMFYYSPERAQQENSGDEEMGGQQAEGEFSGKLTFDVELPNLGSVGVKLLSRGQALQVSFAAESQEALNFLAENLPSLAARLGQVGYVDTQLESSALPIGNR